LLKNYLFPISAKIDYTGLTIKFKMEEFPMTENNQSEAPKKKISLQEAMKKQLENKKNQGSVGKGKMSADHTTKKMTSQQTKKASNTRRKMGV
jgi:hypothetical protein